ncbi:MAG: His/Gly/Thr/Pro-type tRNA ligase C-terminal domain-containing protein [Bacilli bacterium]|nr:His/Gly/Thr/Pro-type tRNA ligase C-terminal domain-containing protein [Bacilli bacterium]MDD4407127.1 His/Gly/Thr/Pro-type tRNA ligase C-terminal domain-containing protein [Bacilli bacterium]
MKVSQIGLIPRKLESLDSQFPVQDMLIQTGQVTQFSSGIYGYGHIPFLVKKNINQIISDVLTKYGCSEIALPLLQPECLWQESGRLEKYVENDVMFRSLTNKGNYCLAPTAEEAVVSYAKPLLTSYKHLPVTYFQIGEKFRNEIRTRGYLLRGKVFEMMDAYSFGRNQKDLDFEYDKMKEAYIEIFNTLGLDTQVVIADNGDMGGKRSEEFMCLSLIGEDKILVDEKTGRAFNSELLEKPNYIDFLKDNYGIEDISALVTKKAVELGHIFQLGDVYGKSMNATYRDEKDQQQYFVMGCYGIGVSRTLALVYENNIIKSKDGKFEGVVLPLNITPYLIYIIPKLDEKDKIDQALFVYNKLNSKGVKVLYDDRVDMGIGAKIKDSKIVGIPYVVVFGNTLDQGFVEVENNLTNAKTQLSLEEFIKTFNELQITKKINNSIEKIIEKQ